MRKCKAVQLAKYECKIGPNISEPWAIYLIFSVGIRKCYLELTRACKNNHLLFSYFLDSHKCGRVPAMFLPNPAIHLWTCHPGIYLILKPANYNSPDNFLWQETSQLYFLFCKLSVSNQSHLFHQVLPCFCAVAVEKEILIQFACCITASQAPVTCLFGDFTVPALVMSG